jgi:hypothetical protein
MSPDVIFVSTNPALSALMQLPGASAEPFCTFACEPVVNADVTAIGPTKVLKTQPESREIILPDLIILGEPHEHADATHAVGLLRSCGKRQHRY